MTISTVQKSELDITPADFISGNMYHNKSGYVFLCIDLAEDIDKEDLALIEVGRIHQINSTVDGYIYKPDKNTTFGCFDGEIIIKG